MSGRASGSATDGRMTLTDQNHIGADALMLLVSSWRHRSLAWQLVRRDVTGRYRGSALGIGWAVASPLILLGIYTFLFGEVLGLRWGADARGTTDFALVVFVGLLVHGFFAEVVNRAPSLVYSQPNYVRKVVFPLEILPIVALGSALFHLAISTAILCLAVLVVRGPLPASAAAIPLALLPLVMMTLGVALALAALGVFLRDIAQLVGFVTMALLFLSPVFFPLATVSERYRWVFLANPLTHTIEQLRGMLLEGRFPAWADVAWMFLGALGILMAGGSAFRRLRKAFADVV